MNDESIVIRALRPVAAAFAACLAGALFLGLASAIEKIRAQEPKPPEEIIRLNGKIAFRVLHSRGDQAEIQPLLAPHFLVRFYDGEHKELPNEILQCDLEQKAVKIDDVSDGAINLLRCGATRYQISSTRFQK